MKISPKGRYAIRLMIDLAEHKSGEYIPLMDVAKRQGISEKYLESIVAMLSKSGYLRSLRGKGGGYCLTKEPKAYTIGSILRTVEGSFAPVPCLECEPNTCEKIASCKTIQMWMGFQKMADEYFDGITIQDLIDNAPDIDNYVI